MTTPTHDTMNPEAEGRPSGHSHRRIGLALGGGGIRGLAHVAALEELDAQGIRPALLAGTSMGALMGALYASGKTGREIRELIDQHTITRTDKIGNVYAKKHFLRRWLDSIRFSWHGSGLLRVDGFLRHLLSQLNAEKFEDLPIPLRVVATDFYAGKVVVFEKGPLLPALQATIAIPGIFEPVEWNDTCLLDGGVCNNVPWDILAGDCDFTIAVDVAPAPPKPVSGKPNMIEATAGMFDLLMARATQAKLENDPPDIYFRPRIDGVRMLEFHKASEVFRQASGSIPEFRRMLEAKA